MEEKNSKSIFIKVHKTQISNMFIFTVFIVFLVFNTLFEHSSMTSQESYESSLDTI